MRFRYLAYSWTIVVGGWLIFLGWPPREPLCIICTPTLFVAAGAISLAVGAYGVFNERNIAAGRRVATR